MLTITSIASADDTEIWTDTSVNFAKTENGSLRLSNATRGRATDDEIYLYFFRFGPTYNLTEDLSISVNYVFLRIQNPAGIWFTEHREDIDIHQKFKLNSLKLAANFRLEFRSLLQDRQQDFFRSRYGFRVNLPIFNHRFYVFSELFYDHKKTHWEQNRTFLGYDFPNQKYSKFLAAGFQSFKSIDTGSWDFRPTFLFGLRL